nr:reverse transcriptase domain-containing protein [Tanacetum cinerariifolium]
GKVGATEGGGEVDVGDEVAFEYFRGTFSVIHSTYSITSLLSFTDAFILMPKFGLTIKSLLTNKEKLFELARTPPNEHCSAVLLKKLPEKLGDPGKFLIPCDFLGMDEYLALADLGASINIMPLSVWNKLSLLELSPTCMTLKLANLLISCQVKVAEDVFVKIERALIDVYKGELTLRVANKSVTFNLDQTSSYFANYDAKTINRIHVIDIAYEEYSQEVLGFFSLLTNKEKLFELARTPPNEHCSAVLLKKLPEKLGDPGKFLIPCDFLGMDEYLALADLGMNTASSSSLGTLLSNTISNPKEDLKGITTRSRIAYKGPMIPTTSSPPKVVECETEVTKDMVPPTNNRSTKNFQPSVVQVETQLPNSEPVVTLVVKPVEALVVFQ